MIAINCDNCLKEFSKPRTRITNTNFCSKTCYTQFLKKQKRYVNCANCNQLCSKTAYRSVLYKNLCCSLRCRDEFKRKNSRQTVSCSHCGKMFERKKKKIKKSNFCSVKCAVHFRNKNNMVYLNCPTCDKLIQKPLSRVLTYENNFCSLACSIKFYASKKRSKCEMLLEEYIKEDFPDLDIVGMYRTLLAGQLVLVHRRYPSAP